MKKYYSLFVVTFLFSKLGISLEIESSGDIVNLYDSNPTTLMKAGADIKNWSHLNCELDKSKLKKTPSAGAMPDEWFIDVAQCIPDKIKKYLNVNPSQDGPNCWNFALYSKEIISSLRFTTPDEMSFFTDSPLCKKIGNLNEVLPGDIGAIRKVRQLKNGSKILEEKHGFIVVSKDIAFTKNGLDKRKPYSISTMEDVFKEYDVKNYEQCFLGKGKLPLGCNDIYSFFRCDSMKSYVEKNKNIPSYIFIGLRYLNVVQDSLENAVIKAEFGYNNADDPGNSDYNKAIKNFNDFFFNFFLTSLNKENRINEATLFILDSMQVQMLAIASQGKLGTDHILKNRFLEYSKSLTEATLNYFTRNKKGSSKSNLTSKSKN